MSDQPPGAAEAAPMSPYRPSSTRGRITQLLLAAAALTSVFSLVIAVVVQLNLAGIASGAVSQADLDVLLAASDTVTLVSLVVTIATAIAFLAWLSRAVDNVPAPGGGRPPASPRWAIAWWFIPFADLGMPYEVVRDLRARMRGDSRLTHSPLLVGWWFAFIFGQILAAAAERVPMETLAQISATLSVAAVAQALTAIAGVLAIIVVHDIESAARRRAARLATGEPMGIGGLDGDAETSAKGQTGFRMRPSWVGFATVTASFILAVAVPAWATSAEDTLVAVASVPAPPETSPSLAPEAASSEPSVPPDPSGEASRCGRLGFLPHEAEELEPLLPVAIQGRDMATWSASGQCWLDMAFPTEAGLIEISKIVEEWDVDVADLRMALAGRSDTATDPPYFVYVMSIPDDTDAYDLATFLLLGMIVGPENVDATISGFDTETTTVGGREVYVNRTDVVPQNEHQRGRFYWYTTATHEYLVLTEDEAWAADAFSQLP
jgi:hypothetical protein